MGSGCITTKTPNSSSCATIVPSNCVRYQGDPVPALGICTGDTITEVEQAIINKILLMINGTGITLNDVTLANCPYLLNMFTGKDKTLVNLFQLLIDTSCTYKQLIDELFVRTQPSTHQYDTKCLTVTSNTQDAVIQATIDNLCALNATVQQIIANSGNTTIINTQINNALSNLITSNGSRGINKTVDGTGLTHYNFTALVPPFAMFPYNGPLNLFDSSGKGIVGTSLEGWYLCNGNNGTMDMRGFVPVGATQGVPGPNLDPIVDPVANGDATMDYNLGAKGGKASVVLTKANMPNYNLTGTTSSGTVNISAYQKSTRHQDSNSTVQMWGPDTSGGSVSPVTISGNVPSLNVTVPLGGNSASHENRMPYRAIYWITRFD